MLSIHEIKQIVEAHKEVFITKEEFDQRIDTLVKSFSDLQSSVDRFGRRISKQDQIIKALQNAHK